MISYQVWTVGMEAYFDANDIWKALKQVYRVPPLPNNPIIAKIKKSQREEAKNIKSRINFVCSSTLTHHL